MFSLSEIRKMVDYTGLPTITLILSDSSRKILTKLDDHIVLMSPSDNLRDYRGLAGLLKFSKGDISKFGKDAHPTMRILESWENRPDAQASLKKLFRFLQAMDRHDIIQDLLPTLSK